MLAIAFVTLFERHVLALSQNRKAPRKPSLFGLLQPVFDGFKLFNKEVLFGYYVSDLYFLSIPFFTFFFMIIEWGVVPYVYFFFSFDLSYLFFISLVGGLVYIILLIGLYRKSKYSLLGAVRSRCQRISFEVVFFFFII
jgi:NADH-quinone oxidoreductase subunit H